MAPSTMGTTIAKPIPPRAPNVSKAVGGGFFPISHIPCVSLILYHADYSTWNREFATVDTHLVEKKRARGKTTTRYPDDPEMRDVYEEELRRLRLRAVLLDEAQHLITSGGGETAQWQNCASHHGCGFPWRKRACSSVFLLSLRERCATRRRLLK